MTEILEVDSFPGGEFMTSTVWENGNIQLWSDSHGLIAYLPYGDDETENTAQRRRAVLFAHAEKMAEVIQEYIALCDEAAVACPICEKGRDLLSAIKGEKP